MWECEPVKRAKLVQEEPELDFVVLLVLLLSTWVPTLCPAKLAKSANAVSSSPEERPLRSWMIGTLLEVCWVLRLKSEELCVLELFVPDLFVQERSVPLPVLLARPCPLPLSVLQE